MSAAIDDVMGFEGSPELFSLATTLAQVVGLPGPVEKPSSRPAQPFDWSRWVALVEENQLGAFLGRPLSENATPRLPAGAPTGLAQELGARYLRSAHAAVARLSELRRVLGKIRTIAEPVILKGAAIAPGLYDEAAERECSDLDLWIPDLDACDRAWRLLGTDSYFARGTVDRGHHHLPVLVSKLREQRIELHWNLTTPPLPERVLNELWKHRTHQIGLHGNRVLDPIGALLHHALHALADPIDSPLLRNLFEVGWMASRLDRADRASFRRSVLRWGLAEPAARAIGLAADLFGSPALLARPTPGPLESWCRSRLEWVGSRSMEQGGLEKFRRSVCLTHLERIASGGGTESVARVGLAVMGNVLTSKIADGLGALKKRVPLRARGHFVPIGSGILVHQLDGGAVHFLDGTARMVWPAMTGASASDIAASLERRGIPKKDTAQAMEALDSAGLIQWRTFAYGSGGRAFD